MRLPAITGIVSHRILLNFRVRPEALHSVLPPMFDPLLVNGWAVGGICQVSLSHMRPQGLPAFIGLSSHNAAHRIAVNGPCELSGAKREGVFVPRRDTDSRLNSLIGGRVFPGLHDHARFSVESDERRYAVTATGPMGKIVQVSGVVAPEVQSGSVFSDLEAASRFFQAGSIGWSPTRETSRYDILEFQINRWSMEPFAVDEVYSGFFMDSSIFPAGSVEFDSAFIMRNLEHSWITHEQLCACG